MSFVTTTRRVVLTYVTHVLSRLRSDGATYRLPQLGFFLVNLAAFLFRIVDARVSGIKSTAIRVDTGRDNEILGSTSQQRSVDKREGNLPEDGSPTQARTQIARHDGPN